MSRARETYFTSEKFVFNNSFTRGEKDIEFHTNYREKGWSFNSYVQPTYVKLGNFRIIEDTTGNRLLIQKYNSVINAYQNKFTIE